ncbi:MAG: replicative DNA helicase [Alphaproteobacteria bacterium RIFCSPLOWO2_01_FULL_45_8]|nr:MAG: replicative DNA helicase [Alphaproteobacteria bacterium GWB1_45_5]OFW76735.1 MAG: replicative DNA helicase [Alphaproteobacteria bacterium GWA1_45_9]OFW89817.1 MAG: replicative DNA helicase [Alphaproteobacteria bacterium RIFCSPHIGHO2_01_FULL_41_14]OFW95799.1 MAG: replicative DNA helicase [Alphaproteobacteria bacterium RIFCSPLOWO2_01_FULL_45_8]HCI48949.1 replicative DNA helicase [Holosporales bacterium]
MLNTLSKQTDTLFRKTSPVNTEAEQALLGCILHNNHALEKVSDFLRAEHFADKNNGKVFRAICRLIDQGKVADPITLKDFFEKEQDLSEIGGVHYLLQLADSVVSIGNAAHYGQLIYDLFLRRELIDIGEEMVVTAHGHDLEKGAVNQIEEAEQKLFNLVLTGAGTESKAQSLHDSLVTALKIAEVAYKRDSKVVGITTGLRDIDKWLGGLHPSDLVIVAGRPSMGKTGFGATIAFNAALARHQKKNEGGVVAFFSLEMSSDQIATRLLSQEAKITSDKIRRGELSSSDFPKLIEANRRISELPLYIDDTPALTVSSLRTKARRLKRQQGLDMIVVDYLQLMRGGVNSLENRVQEISEITRGLKALAKELHVPVMALSQLSRAVEQRDDKRPHLSDLRESGSIEQDADVVIFIYREEYYESRKEPEAGTEKYAVWQERMETIQNQADIIIAKQRHGPVGTVKLFFDARFTHFADLAKTQQN